MATKTRNKADVDGPVTTSIELFDRAQDRAKKKAQHGVPPGSVDLPKPTGYYYGSSYVQRGETVDREGKCVGQLRTAYVRLSVGGDGSWKAGKPTWTSIGVVCDTCRAFWPGSDPLPTSNGR